MARINLLPWREAEKRRRQREFAAITAAALVFTVLIGVAVHLFVEALISNQENRNQFLKGEISLLEDKIREIEGLESTRDRLLARMNVIQQLQVSRPEIVHLFDELVTRIPDGVYLSKVVQSGRSVVLNGQAQSNARVSAFMRNVEASKWIGKPLLKIISQAGKSDAGMNQFQMQFQQLTPSGQKADKTS